MKLSWIAGVQRCNDLCCLPKDNQLLCVCHLRLSVSSSLARTFEQSTSEVLMLRVFSAAGKEVAVLNAAEFDEMVGSKGRSILALKKYLSQRIGRSRFRLRMLSETEGELCDDEEISLPLDLQLVILDFWPCAEPEDAEFISACVQNEIDKVEAMLQRPQNPDTRDPLGWPAIHFAVQAGNESCLELLLESRADLEISATEDGSRALHCAAHNGHVGVLKLLLDASANANSEMIRGRKALHCAARNNHLDVVRLLIDAGAEKNSRMKDGRTPLHVACEFDQEEVVRVLLLAGAETGIEDGSGYTALHLAARDGSCQRIQRHALAVATTC